MNHTLADAADDGARTLGRALGLDRAAAGFESALLLAWALGVTRAHLLAHPERRLADHERRCFQELIGRRAGGEPVAYITGRREFFDLELKVTPAVLIPRPETELLVEEALKRMPESEPLRVLDLGTGSGAVALALARQRPRARVTATDAASDALALARENGQRLGLGNVSFVLSDWFAALARERFHRVVANPPYVADGDPHLNAGDLRFEPRRALAAGPDGLDAIRAIVAAAPAHVAAGGWLLLEHGYDQAGACRRLLEQAGFGELFSAADLSGIPRVSGGRRTGDAP